jgi:hypothetical protein
MNADLESIQRQLGRLLSTADEQHLFTAKDYARGMGFQRAMTSCVRDFYHIRGISALEDDAVRISPEKARTVFETEIAKARVRVEANGQ